MGTFNKTYETNVKGVSIIITVKLNHLVEDRINGNHYHMVSAVYHLSSDYDLDYDKYSKFIINETVTDKTLKSVINNVVNQLQNDAYRVNESDAELTLVKMGFNKND